MHSLSATSRRARGAGSRAVDAACVRAIRGARAPGRSRWRSSPSARAPPHRHVWLGRGLVSPPRLSRLLGGLLHGLLLRRGRLALHAAALRLRAVSALAGGHLPLRGLGLVERRLRLPLGGLDAVHLQQVRRGPGERERRHVGRAACGSARVTHRERGTCRRARDARSSVGRVVARVMLVLVTTARCAGVGSLARARRKWTQTSSRSRRPATVRVEV